MRLLLLSALVLVSAMAGAATPSVSRLKVPPGFHVAVYSDQVPSAREMALGVKGTVFVGSMSAGKVRALTDSDHDGHAGAVYRAAYAKKPGMENGEQGMERQAHAPSRL